MKVIGTILWTQDNKLSEKFYKKLGFRVTRSDDEHSVVTLGDFSCMLVSMRDEALFAGDALAGARGKGLYLSVMVDDVDATYQQFLAKGLQPATAPTDWHWGNREFIIKDPDGYKLCLWQKL